MQYFADPGEVYVRDPQRGGWVAGDGMLAADAKERPDGGLSSSQSAKAIEREQTRTRRLVAEEGGEEYADALVGYASAGASVSAAVGAQRLCRRTLIVLSCLDCCSVRF